jgi:hypothetical protein
MSVQVLISNAIGRPGENARKWVKKMKLRRISMSPSEIFGFVFIFVETRITFLSNA